MENGKLPFYEYVGKTWPGEALIKTLVYPPCSMFCYPQILGVWWSCDRPMSGPFPAPPPKPGKKRPGDEDETRLVIVRKNKKLLDQTPPSIQSPGGYSIKFYTGRLRPEVQPLTFLYNIFVRKGTPFVFLLLTNDTPFSQI